MHTDKSEYVRNYFVARIKLHRATHVESRDRRLIAAQCRHIKDTENVLREWLLLAASQRCFVPDRIGNDRNASEFIFQGRLGYLNDKFTSAKGLLVFCSCRRNFVFRSYIGLGEFAFVRIYNH